MGFAVLPLSYRRPARVEKTTSSTSQATLANNSVDDVSNDKSDDSESTSNTYIPAGIPDALSFDRIVDGGTCPPCTIRDFMNYLIYVERAAENLQFFLWYKDYAKRFHTANTPDLALSKEWTQSMEDDALVRIQKELADKIRPDPKPAAAQEMFKGTDFDPRGESSAACKETKDPISTPSRSSSADVESQYADSNANSNRTNIDEAFAAAGAKMPFTIQPFRAEIDRVIATYIVDGAPRQLNLSSREQKTLLLALAYTTHPTAFRLVERAIETALRHQSHPNFIRWSICNGNPPRVFFARALGVGLIFLSTTAAIVLALSSVGRGYRALAAIGWVLGIATFIAAWKGMCVVLHGMHHRHVRPWELFETDEESEIREKRSFDSLGTNNSYEEEPWVIKYKKRNIVRKVFDREVWIKEPALRQIQDTIFVQSMLCALLIAAVLAAIFVVVPAGRFF